MELKPNHICKNSNCKKGENNSRALYFACDYCDKILNWRSMACSKECYAEYMEQVAASRSGNLYPERTDMTIDEVSDLVRNKPINEVKTKTYQDLTEYADSIKSEGLDVTIDIINADIKKPRKPRTKK